MNYRVLTSFLMLTGFLVMTITGVILYFEPHGRVAYWTIWSFLGLTKEDWDTLHIISSMLWVVAGAFHIYFNWKVLKAYIYGKARGGRRQKRELVLASIITLVVVVSSLYQLPPIRYITDLSGYLKDSWVSSPEYEPPFGHAELTSLKVFCKRMNIPPAEAVPALEAEGIRIEGTGETLEEIARKNNTTPMSLYMIVKPLEAKVDLSESGNRMTADEIEEKFAGTGVGRKKYLDLLNELKLDPSKTKALLAGKQIEIKDDETMKAAAERYGVNPIDLVKAILVEDYQITPTD